MGLFEKKRDSRVPDLSRYSSYYENQSSRPNSLAGSAAASALRSQSMTSSSQYYNFNQSHRSNSMRSFDPQRLGSLNSRSNSMSSRSNLPRGNNPIIIHTTRTTDEYGRTKSITTETIEKFGSFELVKKETQELHPPRAPHYAGSMMSNELTSIQEEEPPRSAKKATSKPRGILKIPVKEEFESDDESMYADAHDTAPWERNVGFKAPKTLETSPRVLKKKVSISSLNTEGVPKRQLSEAEMYAKAMEIAKERVYGSQQQKTAEPVPTTFKRYSLRDPKPQVQQAQHLDQPKISRRPSVGSVDSGVSQQSGASRLFKSFKPFRKNKKPSDTQLRAASNHTLNSSQSVALPEATKDMTSSVISPPSLVESVAVQGQGAEAPNVPKITINKAEANFKDADDYSLGEQQIENKTSEATGKEYKGISKTEVSMDDVPGLSSEIDEGFQTPAEAESIVEDSSTPVIKTAGSSESEARHTPKLQAEAASLSVNTTSQNTTTIKPDTVATPEAQLIGSDKPTEDVLVSKDDLGFAHHDSPSQSSQVPPKKQQKKQGKKFNIGKVFALLFKKEMD